MISLVKDSTVKPPAEEPKDSLGYSAVIFDLFITLTDFDAERRRPTMTMQLADALGVDGETFAILMRESLPECKSFESHESSRTVGWPAFSTMQATAGVCSGPHRGGPQVQRYS